MSPDPSLAEVLLRLSEMEVQEGNMSGTVSALMEGLSIEKAQYVAACIESEVTLTPACIRILLVAVAI